MSNKSISHISEYYNEKFSLHGPTPHGVDWNGLSSQFERFAHSAKFLVPKKIFLSMTLVAVTELYMNF